MGFLWGRLCEPQCEGTWPTSLGGSVNMGKVAVGGVRPPECGPGGDPMSPGWAVPPPRSLGTGVEAVGVPGCPAPRSSVPAVAWWGGVPEDSGPLHPSAVSCSLCCTLASRLTLPSPLPPHRPPLCAPLPLACQPRPCLAPFSAPCTRVSLPSAGVLPLRSPPSLAFVPPFLSLPGCCPHALSSVATASEA